MTEEEINWFASVAVLYDCIVFVQKGKWGSQPVLLPRRLYGAPTTLHKV